MVIINNVTILGRLVSEPDLRFIAGSGTAVCKFVLAVDKGLSKAKKQEFKDAGKQTADFIKVVAWGKTGELAGNHLAKGLRVLVNGSIETGSYDDKDGKKVYTTEVKAAAYGGIEFIDWASENEKEDEFTDGFKELDDADIGDSIPF